MPVPVFLDFTPPNEIPDYVALRILEGPSKDGPFTQIERVTAIGTPGNYISYYTSQNATSATDWFVIQWENSGGALSPASAAVQGGTTSLVAKVVQRMLLREPGLNEEIAAQEAEAAISDYYGVVDPYSIDPSTVSPLILSGLTNYALARTFIYEVITSSSEKNKWVAGLVSLDTSSGTAVDAKTVEGLLRLANKDLGRGYGVIALMAEIEVAGGYKRLVGADLSRSIIEVQ